MDDSPASVASPLLPLPRGARSRRPGRLASVVVDELAHWIIGDRLAPGSVLPTETSLCDRFGFSRTSIREGLKLLEERGLVRVEQGRGTTVQPRESWNLLDPLVIRIALAYDHELVLLDDLIAVRRLLERDMTRVAAVRLTEAELASLAETVEQMASALDDYERFRALDLAFHAAVMKASGSEIGRAIVRTIHLHAQHAPRLTAPGEHAALERTVVEHHAIQEALAARDGELAAARMAAHIDFAWAARRDAATT